MKPSKRYWSLDEDKASGLTMVDDTGVESTIGILTLVDLSKGQDILRKM